jgi:hypothetical protein
VRTYLVVLEEDKSVMVEAEYAEIGPGGNLSFYNYSNLPDHIRGGMSHFFPQICAHFKSYVNFYTEGSN